MGGFSFAKCDLLLLRCALLIVLLLTAFTHFITSSGRVATNTKGWEGVGHKSKPRDNPKLDLTIVTFTKNRQQPFCWFPSLNLSGAPDNVQAS